MPDQIIQQATDFLVTYSAGEQRDYERCDTLKEALAAYQEPPMGFTALGISRCRNGIPYEQMDLHATFGRKPVQIYRPVPA